jgi:hypothetical protein
VFVTDKRGALMANEHIELVKKWLDNPESVSVQELKNNVEAANADFVAACAAANVEAACAACAAAANAADADADAAARWVKEYEKVTNAK